MTSQLDISFVIIAFNEADNLPRTLGSLPKGAEIIVLDSQSTDDTVAVAHSFGAKVFDRPFTNYADQKNFALNLATKNWVFALDADEVLDATLCQSIETFLHKQSDGQDALRVCRRLVFMGRQMRYGRTVDYPVRVFRKGAAQFEGIVHEELKFKVPTKASSLQGVLWHHSYRNLEDYFQRFNRYTTLIAAKKDGTSRPSFTGHILRPWFEFVRRYVLLGGFLDGYPGYVYALISSFYSFVKYAKYFEATTLVDNGRS